MNSRHHRPAPQRAAIAPLHRAPQSYPAATAMHHAPNAALLIDFDNVTMGIRSDLQTELRHLLQSDIIKGKVAVQRAYADWRRYPQYMVPLAESSIDTIQATAYGSSKKNATDIRLAVDAVELVFTRPEIGTYILLSGDSDFSSLVLKLKEYGKYVIGVGIRESSSDLLVMNCDEYYSYNALAGLVKNNEEEVIVRDPWELVSEAITRMKRNGDVMRADRLKQVMQEIDNNFDEKNLGMSKFSRFCEEAAKRGHITMNRLENGQLEVDIPPKDARAVAVPSAAPEARPAAGREAAPEGEREARPRRGRRGRGGRDRGERPEGAAPRADVATPAAGAPAIAAPAAAARAQGAEAGDGIGVSGERLTRDEAFSLVKRAVASLVKGDDAAKSADVRRRAFELLGHDSESLGERMFVRILRDAHDADVVDLRRRGDEFEVANVQAAAPVSEQVEKHEAAHKSAASAAAAAAAPVVPRGMGPRGLGPRGAAGRRKEIPPELLMLGVVGHVPSAATAAPAPTGNGGAPEAAAPEAAKKRGGARKAAAKKGGARKKTAAATEASADAKPPAKRARAKKAAAE